MFLLIILFFINVYSTSYVFLLVNYIMCWNKDVSLNTFLFSSFVLGLIIYNNKYTEYKINELNDIYVYIFFMSFILMQLFEFFIWRNINNKIYNKIFTILATLLLLFQPISTNMLITDKILQENMLIIYLAFVIPFASYKFITKNINSSVSKLGHLKWNMLLDTYNNFIDNILIIFWFIFFLFPLFYQKKTYGFLFGFITLIITSYIFYKDKTIASMWCWVVNSVMVYYAVYLLFYLPFVL